MPPSPHTRTRSAESLEPRLCLAGEAPLPSLHVEEATGSITGAVLQEAAGGEVTPLADVSMHLLSDAGGPLATVTTNHDGQFAFHDLAAGSYGLQQVQPLGYEDLDVAIGTGGGSAVTRNLIVDIVLESQQSVHDYRFIESLKNLTTEEAGVDPAPILVLPGGSTSPLTIRDADFVGIDLTPSESRDGLEASPKLVTLPVMSARPTLHNLLTGRLPYQGEPLPTYGGGGKVLDDVETSEGQGTLRHQLLQFGTSVIDTFVEPIPFSGSAWHDAANQLGTYFLQQWAFQQLAAGMVPTPLVSTHEAEGEACSEETHELSATEVGEDSPDAIDAAFTDPIELPPTH